MIGSMTKTMKKILAELSFRTQAIGRTKRFADAAHRLAALGKVKVEVVNGIVIATLA